MRTPVSLGPLRFPTKRDAELHIRDILRTRRGVLVGEDDAVVRDLAARHPDAASKIGTGIASVRVEVFEHGRPCFWIVRTDGSTTDFSYRRALSPPTRRNDVMAAMRGLVSDQIEAFAASRPVGAVCPYTGIPLPPGTGEVHHRTTAFVHMVEDFLRSEGRTVDGTALRSADGAAGRTLADRGLALRWRDYHAEHADLVLVHPGANRAMPPRRTTPSPVL
jgi:hypothetical protein